MVPEGRDEVRRRIDFLYEQAENATGNYNATRAMSAAGRNRGVALSKRSGPRPDPGLDAVARQWFDAARAKLGPTVPAVLPADRLPEPPAGPARSWDRANPGDRDALSVALPELAPGSAGRAPDRAVAELTGGSSAASNGRPRAALEAGTSGLTGARPELPAARPAELPAARPVELPSMTAELSAPMSLRPAAWGAAEPAHLGVPETSDPGPAETAVLPVATLPEPQAAPAWMPRELPASGAAPRHPSPADSKASHRRKLAAARDLLARHAAQFTFSATAFQPVDGQWEQPPWTAPSTAATPSAAALVTPALVTPAPVTPAPVTPAPFDPLGGTGSFTRSTIDAFTDTGAFPQPALTDTGSFTPFPTPFTPDTTRAAKAIAFARAQIGKPCVWGATGPESYDCSSLTRAAWQAAGVTLPRAAHEQALAGVPVALAGLEPGDLVLFFDDDRHVGLHIGDGMMIHAPGPGSTIREESIYGAGESAIHRVIRPA
ncbi:NlpC/P60 family protein [Streptomyces sp. NPDC058145]|uniref:C40 family peptidase n=1 Tax=Streptomyces sp. NPDC058145 TaxID=3346356 RepID=UPI0036E1F68E